MIMHRLTDIKNAQTHQNYRAAYLYFGMSDYFDLLKLKSFSDWAKNKAKKKMVHAIDMEHI